MGLNSLFVIVDGFVETVDGFVVTFNFTFAAEKIHHMYNYIKFDYRNLASKEINQAYLKTER